MTKGKRKQQLRARKWGCCGHDTKNEEATLKTQNWDDERATQRPLSDLATVRTSRRAGILKQSRQNLKENSKTVRKKH